MKKLCLLLAVVFLTACSSKETLLRDLTERDANEIIAVLYKYNIQADKKPDAKGKTFSVTVKSGELAQSVALLHTQGLPRENRPSLQEVFKSSGFAPTPFEERVKFIYGVSQELERTISLMRGVLNARVHVVIPEKANRHTVQQATTASVFINYDSRVDLELQIPAIRKLVSEAIEGLSIDNVEVLANPIKVDSTAIPVASEPVAVPWVGLGILGLCFVLGVLAWFKRKTLQAWLDSYQGRQ